MRSSKSYYADIYIAGDIEQAKQICRKFCSTGNCVTVEPTYFVYKGVEEYGIKVGFIQYPKFPKETLALLNEAKDLAELLRDGLYQDSYLIQTPDEVYWESRR